MKPVDTAKLVNKFLAPVFKIARSRKGKSKLATELQKLTGRSVSRQHIHQWTCADTKKRTEPLLSTSLLLVLAAERVEQNQTNPKK